MSRTMRKLIFLSYLQPNKLAYCYFMADGRRQETLGSETNNFIIHAKSTSQSGLLVFFDHAPRVSQNDTKGLSWLPAHTVGSIIEHCAWGTRSF